ncbi:CU044_5270 family protein [Nonomuraea candida]|uniref:CU044_5270 family protein n=1 Tax=Nonomuraea candida TaxID=359159 RepID=UPI0005B791F7|nr:CU044_5270 family protein [Nonomuraea candida]
MNEIELLREMRSEVPERLDLSGAERRLAGMRAEGTAGMRAEGATGRARQLAYRLTAGKARRPAYRLRWGMTVAGACVLAVAAVAVLRPQDDGVRTQESVSERPGATVAGPGRQTGDPVAVLERAALVADRSAAVELRPDRWFYLKESQHMGADLPAFETWSRLDGRREALRQEGGELKVTAAEKGPTHVGRTQREIEALPSDPDALLAHFRGLRRELAPLSICRPRCAPGIEDDVKAFGAIGWYMKYGPMIPPETAAAMYRALARIPHVTIEPDATDADGRRGVGVVFDAGDGVKASYVLDSADYRYMGMTVVRDGETVGMSVLGAGIVDEPGELP